MLNVHKLYKTWSEHLSSNFSHHCRGLSGNSLGHLKKSISLLNCCIQTLNCLRKYKVLMKTEQQVSIPLEHHYANCKKSGCCCIIKNYTTLKTKNILWSTKTERTMKIKAELPILKMTVHPEEVYTLHTKAGCICVCAIRQPILF